MDVLKRITRRKGQPTVIDLTREHRKVMRKSGLSYNKRREREFPEERTPILKENPLILVTYEAIRTASSTVRRSWFYLFSGHSNSLRLERICWYEHAICNRTRLRHRSRLNCRLQSGCKSIPLSNKFQICHEYKI